MYPCFAGNGKKGELLKASLTLFADKGYDAVSVRDIAKAAGVSEAALYKHFQGKEDMALYIFTNILTDYTARLKAVQQGAGGSIEKLSRIVEVTYDLYDHYPAAIRFALLSQYYFWEQVCEDIKPHLIIRDILEQGMAASEIPRQEVYFAIAIYTGIMMQPLSQYPYFHDVLPEFDSLKKQTAAIVRKVFQV